MTDHLSISRTAMTELAAELRLGTVEDADRLHAELVGALRGYTDLETDLEDVEPTRATVSLLEEADPHNAFVSRFDIGGDGGPLSDLDVAIKDNVAVAGVPMTAGSEVFADATPARDATVVEALLDTGARLVGKANMDELAYGPTGETSAFGPAENPVAPGRVTGGSSSGSAAAVAGGLADAALGTDTGGSVRIPASFCRLVGFKPTWGAVSRAGVVELAYTLDHVGTLTRDTRTAARVLDVLVGPDPADPSTDWTGAADLAFERAVEDAPAVADLSLGVPEEFYGDHVADPVEGVVRERIDAMEAAGATVRPVSVPLASRIVSPWNAIVNVEFATFVESAGTPLFRRGPVDPAWGRDAAAGLADDSRRFGDVVRRKAIEGKYLVREHGAIHYAAARNRARALAEQFAAAFVSVDLLVTPTMTTTPIERGAWSPDTYSEAGADAMPPLAIHTRPADVAGIPAVTVPAGEANELPIGLQFMGPAREDAAVLAAAAVFERFREESAE